MLKKSFYYLWGTQTISNAADVVYIMALTYLVLDQTNSALAAVLVPFFRVASQTISGLLAPLLVSKYQLPLLLFGSQLGQFILFGGLTIYLILVPKGHNFYFVFTIVFFMSFLDGWTTPARNALVPRLAEGKGLLKANGLISTTDQIVQCAGWGLSGILVAVLGSAHTLLLSLALYGVAMAFTMLIKDPTESNSNYFRHFKTSSFESVIEREKARPSRWHIMKEGWIALWHHPRLRTLTFMDAIDMLGGSIWVGSFTLLFVTTRLNEGTEWWGFINSAYFAGTIGGGLFVVTMVNRLEKRVFTAMVTGMIVYVILTVLYALNTHPYMALVLILLTGPVTELSAISRRTLIQRSVHKDLLPKVLSAQSTLTNFIFIISLLFMAWLADKIGIVHIYLLGAGISLSAATVGLLHRKSFTEQSPLKVPITDTK
ncbi:MFS transporter [Paenibacillus sediminis]|uniref:MFS family permease n=1 Tax=Paenibacillus sediminis TaxID=664909 RepID=A0ABS4H3Q0_9BACL|nr:MFS transporter [Paenibacillus sediminis]MBP1937133.1 MFS family permease [Paenibacillus sediminis]